MFTMEWRARIQIIYKQFLTLLGQCDLCGNTLFDKSLAESNLLIHPLLCVSCYAQLPLFKQTLIQADLLNWPAINRALPNISFDHLFCLSPYLLPFTHWLVQLKYQGRFELATLFANLLAQQWQAHKSVGAPLPVDLVLSVPLHISKWQVRGFNQAHLIAKPFAKQLQLPYDNSALIRVKKNLSQVGKTGIQRRNSLTKAFELAKDLPKHVKHIVLIDDVMTTGSTASEISKLLKHNGVDRVTVITVCLTLPNT